MTTSPGLTDNRPSPIAGRWYPADPDRLAQSVDAYIAQAHVTPVDGKIIGVLAPHAGHRYSGPVAGHAFKLLKGLHYDTVVIVGPSHYPYPAPIITTGHQAYITPLGTIPVNQTILAALSRHVPLSQVRGDSEHALEIELPFLQRTLEGAFELVPLALTDQSADMAQALGETLAQITRGTSTLLVASSDLSHFYPQEAANRFDRAILDAVARYDPIGVIEAEVRQEGFACGRGAIATVMIAARALGANAARVVAYATSGDVTHDYRQVVGYGAAVFYQQTGANTT